AKDLKVNLPHSDIRKLELEECQICYADGLVTTYAGENYQHFLVDVFDSNDDREVLSSVRDVVSNSIGNLPKENEVGWICSCSRFNFNDTVVCSKCGITKEQAFKLNDPEFLSMTIETHKKNEEKKRTLAVEEAEKKRKVEIKRKFKRAIVVVICLLFVFIIGRLIILSNRSTFSSETDYGYKSELSSSYESGYSVLDITIDSVTNNSSYTVCTGSVKNNGTKTYKYIEVKGSFKDSGGDVVDTDWTYAAGSEGLSPGESSTFRLSVPKNSRIDSCSVSILGFS
ncbi:MAG: FxLYD domain-containing protein, partial [Eubacteriales bacterium]|nr:FxLYD domain-containing protein [Eubacteriales bacterium]